MRLVMLSVLALTLVLGGCFEQARLDLLAQQGHPGPDRWRLDPMNANQWLLGVGVPSLFVIVFF